MTETPEKPEEKPLENLGDKVAQNTTVSVKPFDPFSLYGKPMFPPWREIGSHDTF